MGGEHFTFLQCCLTVIEVQGFYSRNKNIRIWTKSKLDSSNRIYEKSIFESGVIELFYSN